MGGGILLIAAMPGFVPLSALIPLHGAVQVASNVSRALMGLRHVRVSLFISFAGGALVGSCMGALALPHFSWDYLPVPLGVLIILLTWAPPPEKPLSIPGKFVTAGAVQTFLALFIGVAGPLNSPLLLRERLSRDEIVVTHAAQMTSLHLLKVITFGFVGFSFYPHIPILASMVVGATIGSVVGTRLRSMLPEVLFRKILKILITILCIRMILRIAV